MFPFYLLLSFTLTCKLKTLRAKLIPHPSSQKLLGIGNAISHFPHLNSLRECRVNFT